MTDLLIASFLIFWGWKGWKAGLGRQLLVIAAVVGGYLAATHYYWAPVPALAQYVAVPGLGPDSFLNQLVQGDFNRKLQVTVSYVLLFVGVFLLIKYGVILFGRVAQKQGLSIANRLSGLLVGVTLALFVAGLAVNVLLLFPNPDLQRALSTSTLGGFLIREVNFDFFLPSSSRV
jgi:uncharacterized membrane protein required for colicin V production